MGEKEKPANDPYKKYKDFKWQNPDEFKNGPVDDDSRKCRDCICCIIFIVFFLACVFVGYLGFTKGDPKALLYVYDEDGNACGHSKGYEDYPYLYFYSIISGAASLSTETATNGNQVDLDFVHQAGNVIYYGRTANAPEVGDVRITFEKTVPAKVTVVSVVEGNTFKPFVASNKKKFQTLRMGKKSIDEIFEEENESNTMWTWILRIVGILLVISGFKSLFSFLETLLKVVPFLSSIFAFGVGIICTIVGIVYSLIVIALAWIFYRPVLGIILLLIAGFLVWVFAFNGKKKLAELANKGKAAPAEAPAE
jgi:hypothetical protein